MILIVLVKYKIEFFLCMKQDVLTILAIEDAFTKEGSKRICSAIILNTQKKLGNEF